MTPAQEIDILIAEQQKDDTHQQRPERWLERYQLIPLDARMLRHESGGDTFSALVYVDDEGEVSSFIKGGKKRAFAGSLNAVWHGTLGGYTNHYCRCDKCKQAQATHVRKRYYERQGRSVPERVETSCAHCGDGFQQKAANQSYCSHDCRYHAHLIRKRLAA